MKQVLVLLSFFIVLGCGSDDSTDTTGGGTTGGGSTYNFAMVVTVDDIDLYEATISWNAPLPSEWGSVVYRVVVNNEVIADGLQGTSYTLTGLDDNRGYNGTVFATGINGDETFAHFALTTLPYTIHHGTLVITTQEEVDDFYYTNCYSLYIDGSDITDLSPMTSLMYTSSISINNTSIGSLEGLDNFLGSYHITIKNNPNLEDISAISAAYPGAWNTIIENNTSLTSVPDLAVTSDYDYNTLIIKNCPITELPSFGNTPIFHLELDNLLIQDFSAFRFTPSIIFFEVRNMPQITGFNGFDNITDLYHLTIRNNPLLTNLGDLETLINSAGTSGSAGRNEVFIINNQNLTNFCGLTQWMNNTTIWNVCLDPPDCNNLEPQYFVSGNAYNPTEVQIESPTDCSL